MKTNRIEQQMVLTEKHRLDLYYRESYVIKKSFQNNQDCYGDSL